MVPNNPADYEGEFLAAIQLWHAGQVSAACRSLLNLIQRFPTAAELHNSLAIILIQDKDLAGAVKHFKAAVELEPGDATYRCNYGSSLLELKKADQAIEHLQAAIRIDASMPDAYYNLGNAYTQRKDYTQAIKNYDLALMHRPDWDQAYLNRGNALVVVGDDEAALLDFNKTIALNPREGGFYLNRAKVHIRAQRFELAKADCEAGLNLAPELEDLRRLLAEVLLGLGRPEDVLPELKKMKVNEARAYLILGAAYSELGQIDESMEALERSIALDPNSDESLGLMGQCCLLRGKYKMAISFCRKAIALNPETVRVRENLSYALLVCGEPSEALRVNEEIVRAKRSLGVSVSLKQTLSEWTNYSPDLEELNQRLRNLSETEALEDPWSLYCVIDEPSVLKEVAERYVQKKILPVLHAKKYTALPLTHKGRIRLGYFSPDFRIHPVSHLARKLFALHSRADFEVIAFSYGRAAANDEMREQLKGCFDEFIEVTNLSDAEILALAQKHEIDIAIDLAGLTGEVRPSIFGRRVAPVQVNYLGLAGTTGSPWHDYIIADAAVLPLESFHTVTEKVVHLPFFMPFDTDLNNTPAVRHRASYNLPASGFIYCCFNNNFKITPPVFDSWLRILKAVPGSCLWLRKVDEAIGERLLSYAEKAGIERARFIFAERLGSVQDHLARYQVADLFLDTFPYNGHATSMDATWMGLPVLTLTGLSMHTRVAASMLKSVQLDELVVADLEAYEKLAIELALNPAKLKPIKDKLISAHTRGEVFEMNKYTQNLEQAYRTMHQRCRQGLAPESIISQS